MTDKPCCPECKGPSPYYFCQNKYVDPIQAGCQCHQRQDRLARLKQSRLYGDSTANTAIGNVMKENKRK